MKKIIFTIFLISSFSAVKAQSTSYFDTLTNQEKKMAFDYLVELYHKLEQVIKQTDSCHYNHEKYLFCEALNNDTITKIKSPFEFLKFNLLSAEGDRDRQTVTVTLLLTNSSLHQKIYLDKFGSEAIDEMGNACAIEKIQVGAGTHFGNAYTNTPIRIVLTFQGVMPGTEKFNFIALTMSSTNSNTNGASSKKLVEITNTVINW